ncbi:MAG: HlyD family efflux transporter periplasmic adaptor subunit [Acidobacteria bacterium]|nr:HlyD family efflux transporter periplasmic adaptor subunit [Acidobacteriota bacterium]
MSRRKNWIAAAAVAIAIAVVILIGAAGAQQDEVSTLRVQKGKFIRTVTAEGYLKASASTPLAAPRDAPGGLKIAWLEKDGSYVREGDVIVRFDPTDFENELAAAGVDRQSIDNRFSAALESSGATSSNLRRDASQAQREYDAAQKFEVTDADIFSRHEVIESMIDSDLALERREYAEDMLGVRGSITEAEREMLRIEQRTADTKLDRARRGLEALEIIAPHPGIVIFQRDWRGELPTVGSSVFPGRPIAEIPDIDSMEAEIFILEADAGGVSVGQTAEVRIDSVPNRTFRGEVKRVDSVARPRVRGVPVQYFGVIVSFAATEPEAMKPGARVSAKITIEELDDVVTVPRQAVWDRDGRRFVHVERGGKFVPAEIQTGAASLGRVVVTSGLDEGDLVVLSGIEEREIEGDEAAGDGGTS